MTGTELEGPALIGGTAGLALHTIDSTEAS